MNAGKTLLIAGGVGILTIIIAWMIFGLFEIGDFKSMILPLFLIGVVLYFVLEITGAHQQFCITYLK